MQVRGTLAAFCIVVIVGSSQVSAWTWECINKQCLQGADPQDNDPNKSLELCRLTCGNFGALWPQPTGHVAISDKVRYFHPSDVSFNLSSVADFRAYSVHLLATRMIRKFQDDLQKMCEGDCGVPAPRTSIVIALVTASGDLTQNWLTDEGYSLEVQTRGNQMVVTIQGETIYGARHGLETLSQLLTYIPASNQLVIVTTAKVSDKPAYPHRGLLLDSARHFLPLSTIERTVDAMAAVKMNVLHWHISDSQSFPLVLDRVPQLARFGAYSPAEVYTLSNVSELVGYARARGVRILLELDMPAHAGNGWQWGESAGLGALAVCVNRQPWRQYCLQPPCGQLNPANPALYDVLREVFRDLIHYFSTDAIHMGGDEVYLPCWNQSTVVTDWMKAQGKGFTVSDFLDVWGDFHNKAFGVTLASLLQAEASVTVGQVEATLRSKLPQSTSVGGPGFDIATRGLVPRYLCLYDVKLLGLNALTSEGKVGDEHKATFRFSELKLNFQAKLGPLSEGSGQTSITGTNVRLRPIELTVIISHDSSGCNMDVSFNSYWLSRVNDHPHEVSGDDSGVFNDVLKPLMELHKKSISPVFFKSIVEVLRENINECKVTWDTFKGRHRSLFVGGSS